MSQETDGSDADPIAGDVERSFSCTACKHATTHEVGRLQASVQGTCDHCGEWTVGTAATGDLVEAARETAERLAGPTLTERQATAHLLREVLGLGRQSTAAAMETTASNVDNLHRRADEKLADARRVLDGLAALDPS